MITDKFEIILKDLSQHLNINLRPDEHHSCLIVLEDKLKIQLELDPTETHLVLGCILGEVPSGKFREEVLFQALKENGKRYPRLGTFAFSRKLNSLVLFEMLLTDAHPTETILTILTPFIRKAKAWSEALAQGQFKPLYEENYLDQNDAKLFFGK